MNKRKKNNSKNSYPWNWINRCIFDEYSMTKEHQMNWPAIELCTSYTRPHHFFSCCLSMRFPFRPNTKIPTVSFQSFQLCYTHETSDFDELRYVYTDEYMRIGAVIRTAGLSTNTVSHWIFIVNIGDSITEKQYFMFNCNRLEVNLWFKKYSILNFLLHSVNFGVHNCACVVCVACALNHCAEITFI